MRLVELPYGETTLTATLPERTRTFSNTGAVAGSVEEAVALAEKVHGAGASIAHVKQPPPARPD